MPAWREVLTLLGEFDHSYSLPIEFKNNPHYLLDRGRYRAIGDLEGGQHHKALDHQSLSGLYVKAHWNIHHAAYSVKPPMTGETLGHVNGLHLGGPDGVRFEVQESGRRRAVETGQKNPHAFIHGLVMGVNGEELPSGVVPIGYSPRLGSFFQVTPQGPGLLLKEAREVHMLPPDPEKVRKHLEEIEKVRKSGGSVREWLGKNKAPAGRVFASLGKEN